MLKKIVLLVAVISGASSVSFGAVPSKTFSEKVTELRKLKKRAARTAAAAVAEVPAAEITRLEGVVAAARTALDTAQQAHGAAVATAQQNIDDNQDDDQDETLASALTTARAPITAAQNALTAAEAALTTARQTNSNRADLVAAAETAANALKDSDVNTFAVKAGIAAVDTNEALFVSRNGKDLRYAGTTLKALTTVATTLVGAALAKKVVAAFKSADVKAAVGLKAKAKAFGKALNLAPRQSKLLYGSLVTALVATGANYGLAHFDATKAY